MHSFLAGWLPLLVAVALIACLYSVRDTLTRRGSWQRLVTWPLPLLAFFPVWIGGAALVLSLVGGDLAGTHHFEGSRGSVLWQERSVVMLRLDVGLDLERQWFEIVDDSGKRIAKVDYVKWLAVQTDIVEVLGAGQDFVWLDGKKLGLHTRDLYTGKWLRGQNELVGNVALAKRPFHYDATTHTLDVETNDGHTLHLR
jgi:hypothetical protein